MKSRHLDSSKRPLYLLLRCASPIKDLIDKYKGVIISRPLRGLLIGLTAYVVVLLFGLFDISQKLELLSLDIRYRVRPKVETSDRIVLVNYDDHSLELYGEWPWSRRYQVILLETLRRYRVGYIGFDVFFSEPEPSTILTKGQQITDPGAGHIVLSNPDSEFADAIKRAGNVYLAYSSRDPLEGMSREDIPKLAAQIRQSHGKQKVEALSLIEASLPEVPPYLEPFIYKAIDIEPPLFEFSVHARGTGFAQPGYSSDGTTRDFILYRYYNGRLLYPLSLVMLSDIMGLSLKGTEILPGQKVVFHSSKGPSVSVPVDKHLQALLNWPGRFEDSFTHVSFRDIVYLYVSDKTRDLALKRLNISKPNLNGLSQGIKEEVSIFQLLPEADLEEIVRDTVATAFTLQALKIGLPHSKIITNLKELLGPEETKQKIDELTQSGVQISPPTIRVIKNGVKATMSANELEGKIVLVGLTGKGTIDLNPIPFQKDCPMVFYHASAINMMLNGSFLHYPPYWLRYTLPLSIALVIGLIGAYRSVSLLSVVTTLTGAGLVLASYLLWVKRGQWIELILPLSALLLAYLFSTLVQFIRVYSEKARVRAMFSAMVSPAVLTVMERHPDRFSLTGERRFATTYFSKIEGIETITHSIRPEDLPPFLSAYLTPLSDVILDYGGYIDKYEGVVIMADFGVPLEDNGNPYKCAYAALEQRFFIEPFKWAIKAKYNIEAIVSIGLNAGYVSAGNMGSDRKFQYTVMGDAVNMAARFMAANSIYHSSYPITSEETFYLIKDYVYARPLDKLLLKGKTIPTKVYDILGWKAEAYAAVAPKTLKALPTFLYSFWANAPQGCIDWYADFWQRQYERTDHPLAERLVRFFGTYQSKAQAHPEGLQPIQTPFYKTEVHELIKSIRPAEYFDLMAKVGEPEHTGLIDLFDRGLSLYWQRQWEQALLVFQKALTLAPKDRPTLHMIERIKDYKLHPPKEGWLGEFIQTKK